MREEEEKRDEATEKVEIRRKERDMVEKKKVRRDDMMR
jgi:hypothetical protein